MSTTASASSRSDAPPEKRHWLPVSDLEFVGCDRRPMTVAEYDAHDGRVEFFDSESGLAWLVRVPAGPGHELPREILSRLVTRISMFRGAPIARLRASQMRLSDAASGQFRSVQADQILFLRPLREDPRNSPFLAVGEIPCPDVVVEVDHTTDVRGNRLRLYEEWRFPEVWIEVPDAHSPSRPPGLEPGLDIYLLEGDRFVRARESRAFPGWQATEIHRGMNEMFLSAETAKVLWRVGRALGEPEGTGPDDDPWLGRFARERWEAGFAEGVTDVARVLLRQRGIGPPPKFPEDLSSGDRAALRRATPAAVVSAAATAISLADFFTRLREFGCSRERRVSELDDHP